MAEPLAKKLQFQNETYRGVQTMRSTGMSVNPLAAETILHDIMAAPTLSVEVQGYMAMHTFPYREMDQPGLSGTLLDSMGNPSALGFSPSFYMANIPAGQKLVGLVTFGPLDEDIDAYHLQLTDALQAISPQENVVVPFDPLSVQETGAKLAALVTRQSVMAKHGGKLPGNYVVNLPGMTINYGSAPDGSLIVDMKFER